MERTIAIRPSRREDASALRTCLTEVWHATYDAFIGADRVDKFVALWLTDAQLHKEADSAAITSLLAIDGEAIVGQALLREVDICVVRLARLYVLPAFHARGVGKSLFLEGIGAFPEAHTVQLEVYEPNVSAIGFYRSLGFVETVRQQSEFAPAGIREVLMELKL